MAELVEYLGREILELALGEPRAAGSGDDVTKRPVNGVRRPVCSEFVRRLAHEIHVEIDVRALDHADSIHLPAFMEYTLLELRRHRPPGQ